MLSILIPTYNYTIFPLVSKIHELLELEQIPFEIRCLDDASDNPYCQSENEKINNLKNASYKILEKNIGRSKIRNLLGKNAIYDWLLFMDADVYPIQDDFIKNYIKYLKTEPSVVYGGIRYTKEKPPAEELLRWEYGKHREALAAERRKKNPYLSFLTLNFLIHKNILLSVPFNESIPNLRHEDTLFSYDLKTNNIPIYHI
jgi:cellulose synthase/poly-beta-1,6-N-acetylglucosamine synthase-like glycosyltransferase